MFTFLSLRAAVLYTALFLLSLILLCSCATAPKILGDTVAAQLVQAGFTSEQAQVVARVVAQTAEDLEPGVPQWVQGVIDIGLLALFPAMAFTRNKSRMVQMSALRNDVVSAALPNGIVPIRRRSS